MTLILAFNRTLTSQNFGIYWPLLSIYPTVIVGETKGAVIILITQLLKSKTGIHNFNGITCFGQVVTLLIIQSFLSPSAWREYH